MRSSEDISLNDDYVETTLGPKIKSRAPLHANKGSTTSLNEVRFYYNI